MPPVLSWSVRILVLGGTSFVGRAIVDDALRTGFDVTLFSRGRTGTGLFPGLPRRRGDRDTGDCAALRDGRWDAVVDVSGYVPRHVGQAMDALGGRAGRYLFISSHAVYQTEGVGPGSTEDTPRRPPARDTEELNGETYGRLKVACEDDVTARYGDRAAIVRPVKVIDVRDLARLVVQLLADDRPAADTLAWDRARGEPPLPTGFTPAQEQGILAEHAPAPGR
jgi:nucleoside-diphosphate-sugar epimerase